jgi:hypothetical protein
MDKDKVQVWGLTNIVTNIIRTLRGLSPRANYTERLQLVGDVNANFCE